VIKKLLNKLKLLAAYLLLAAAVAMVFVELGFASFVPWLLLVALAVYYGVTHFGERDAFLVWSDDYNTGIRAIDEDHKQLLNLVNNLRAAVLCNTGEEFERHTLQELAAYTGYHFDKEEALMQQYDYPDFEGHKAQHDQFKQYVHGFVTRYEEQGEKVLEDVADHLTRWLLQHINGTDMQYVPFFKEKGVS
jgi:hemerythrin